jgi:hypothetical protein
MSTDLPDTAARSSAFGLPASISRDKKNGKVLSDNVRARVLAHMPSIVMHLSAGKRLGQLALRRPDRGIFRSEENLERAIDDFRLRVAEGLLSSGVPTDDAAVDRHDENCVLGKTIVRGTTAFR